MHIGPFEQGNRFNHDPYRARKLLLHKKQIIHLRNEIERKKLTLIPLTVYFKKHWVKLEIGLCRGKKKFDKRQKIKTKESKKQIANIMKYSK
jgi:SsrA-binding protein